VQGRVLSKQVLLGIRVNSKPMQSLRSTQPLSSTHVLDWSTAGICHAWGPTEVYGPCPPPSPRVALMQRDKELIHMYQGPAQAQPIKQAL
jgi:hypothetical protein